MADPKEPTEAKYHLIGLYTRYSSWTARIELILKYFSIPHTTQFINFSDIPTHSPTSGLVPLLIDRSLSPTHPIHDPLSIALHLAHSNPSLPLLPPHPLLRALALSAIAEMHSGFQELRGTYHTNFLARYRGTVPISEKGKKEIERMLRLWGEARKVTGEVLGDEDGGYLYGGFGVVDAFFWPVLWRFRTYNLPLDTATPEALKWMQKMWSDPKIKEVCRDYFRQAEREETRVERYEDIFKGIPGIEVGVFGEDWEFEIPENGGSK